jgi:hypothetical protein
VQGSRPSTRPTTSPSRSSPDPGVLLGDHHELAVRRIMQARHEPAIVAVLPREHDLADHGSEVLLVEGPERLDR